MSTEEEIVSYILKLCSKRRSVKPVVNYVTYKFNVHPKRVRTLLSILVGQGCLVIQDGHLIAAYRR